MPDCRVIQARESAATAWIRRGSRRDVDRPSIVRTVKSTNAEDLADIERAGRRCDVCRSGRHWRQFKVLRPEAGEPVVLCGACAARYETAPPVQQPPAEESPKAAPAPAPQPASNGHERRPAQHEDRLKKVLRELPRGEHSTGVIAKAAGLNRTKTLGRLRQLEASGEVRQVGKRWSTEQPASDIEMAFDRLQARTSHIRIVRDDRLRDPAPTD